METAHITQRKGKPCPSPVAPSSMDFVMMLNALAQPEAFPDHDEPITIVQTHASAVLLAGKLAYKLKKPKNLGFLDYSTPALRRHYCGQEVRLNRRLAPQVYLGVAPVLLFSGERLRFGPTFPPDDVPLPGVILDGGCVVDYAVVMLRLPDEAQLQSRVRNGTASPALLAQVARSVAAFHALSHSDEHIASFGELEVIRSNWEENFAQMKPYVGRTLDASTYDRIVTYVHHMMEQRAPLFASRVRQGRIRDCHGDLRLQHVYALDHDTQLAILDGIEFNERFRYSDVASEVAFLTMELEAAGRADLSRAFIDDYVAESGDEAARELLPFYSCYRACVRGKVSSLQLDEPEVEASQREAARQEAASLFALAADYASGPTRPTLVIVGGIMGTGKSTLALALRHELGWTLFSSDALRKCLARLDPAQPHADAFGQGLYSPDRTEQTYDALLAEARAALAQGRSVLLDASFLRRAHRQAAVWEAAAQGAACLFVECTCPAEMAQERLARRWQARVGSIPCGQTSGDAARRASVVAVQRLEGNQTTGEEASPASDGRPALYDTQRAAWEGFDPCETQHMHHLVVSTMSPLAVNVEQVLDALHLPRCACWLR